MGAFTTKCCCDCDNNESVCCDETYYPITELPTADGHYIYIMRNEFYKDNVIKIGRTNNMVRRVRELNN